MFAANQVPNATKFQKKRSSNGNMFEVLTPEVREILDKLTQQLQSQNKLLEMMRERMDRLERAKKRRKWKE
jgi:hypothetical protein